MIFPKEFLELIDRAAEKYPEDIGKAADYADRESRKQPYFTGMVNDMIRDSIRGLVHSARHSANVAARKIAGEYGRPGKVVVGLSEEVGRAMASFYDYYISGVTLGSIMGEDLMQIADNETAKANGCLFNAKLCQRLRRLVPDGKSVRDAISEAALRKVFKDVKRATDNLAA